MPECKQEVIKICVACAALAVLLSSQSAYRFAEVVVLALLPFYLYCSVYCSLSVLSFSQLFSSDERRAAQQHKVTVHGAPGPEPFTVIGVKEHTTAKQLLNMVTRAHTKNPDG